MSPPLPFPNRRSGRPITADANLSFDPGWTQLEPSIRRFAQRLTPDADHQEDLMQEAMIRFWSADPTRYDFSNRRDARYMRVTLIRHLWDVWGDDGDRFQSQDDATPTDPIEGSGAS
jgi:DNA-directed RNA polymerase specialized sigma24 family protein